MGIYGGIQLPNINEENLDDKKERKQILNYLALLDEKLRYMFQNIDIEENLSEESKEMFLEMGQEIKNLVQDTDGRFSMLTQTVDGINLLVSDPEKGLSAISQKADSISSTVANLSGQVSSVTQTADGLQSTVKSLGDDLDDLDDTMSTVKQTADKIEWIVASGTSASKMTLTDEFLEILADEINIEADVNLYGLMKVYEDSDLSRRGGYIGYDIVDDLFNASAEGIKISNYSDDCYVAAHGSGVTLWADGYGAYLYYYDGNFMPTEDGDQMMGDPDFRWQGVYAKNGTIQTSDRRKKKDIEYDMAKYEEFFGKLKPTQYKMIDGESDRYHIGFISQDVEDTLAECGLESTDFAGFIKTPKRAVRDDASSEILDYHYSLRYDEFVALNTHMIQKLMKRVSDLEAKIEAS